MTRRALLIALVSLASSAYFYEGGGWNQNTRFDLVRAIVERHTVRIDAYHDNTGDKAHLGDHYYTDKAPGASLTAVPAVAVTYGLMKAFGVDAGSDRAVVALSYVATVAAAALPTACIAFCVFVIAGRLGATSTAAAFAALVCALGTPVWAYATVLYGHALAGAGLIVAFLGALILGEPSKPRRQITLAVLTGLAAGWAVITEFPAAIPSALIVGFALWQIMRTDRTRLLPVAGALGAGLGAAASVFMVYNELAFGKLVYVGYTSEEGFEAMRTGFFGVHWPKLSVMYELLFGTRRGLLPLAPVLAIVPVGFWLLIRDRATRAAGLVAGAVALYFLLMTSGYAYWNGGWSYGSRHLGPGLAFMCIGLAPVWMLVPTVVRAPILVLALVSVLQSLVAVATTPQLPIEYQRPMQDLLWPAFKSGDFPIGWQSFQELRPPPGPMSQLARQRVPRASWNVGQLVGLRGHASLIPLLIIWIGAAFVWRHIGITEDLVRGRTKADSRSQNV